MNPLLKPLLDFKEPFGTPVDLLRSQALAALEERLHGFYAADEGDGDGGGFGATEPKAGMGASG